MAEFVLKKLNLPLTTKKAIMHTRYNDKILPASTRNQPCDDGSGGYWKMGHDLVVLDDKTVQITSWTVENNTHCQNSIFTITSDEGKLKLVKGKGYNRVNCFGLGWMNGDLDYLEEMIEELSIKTWDEVEEN